MRHCFSVVVLILAAALLAAGFLAATACSQRAVTPSPTPISTVSTGTPAPSLTASPPATPPASATPIPTATPSPNPTVRPAPCKADFFAQPTVFEGPTSVQFTDLSTGNITGWEWDFGDGKAPSHEQNPQHYYNKNGSYSVTLKVHGPRCQDELTKQGYIEVAGCKT